MVTVATQTMTFDEFLEWYPDGFGRYELIRGVVVEMSPTGLHERVIDRLSRKLIFEVERLQLPYLFPRTCLVKSPDWESGYQPDIIVVDESKLAPEPLWEKAATLTRGESIKLAIEVVSTNWQMDYMTKLADYERLQIPEYWIVDYLGLGGRRYIGSPKVPTVSVYSLVDGEYQVQQFRAGDRLVSPLFPDLQVTVDQILAIG